MPLARLSFIPSNHWCSLTAMDTQVRNDHAKTMLSSQNGTLEKHTHTQRANDSNGNEQMVSAPKGEAGQVPAGRARLT